MCRSKSCPQKDWLEGGMIIPTLSHLIWVKNHAGTLCIVFPLENKWFGKNRQWEVVKIYSCNIFQCCIKIEFYGRQNIEFMARSLFTNSVLGIVNCRISGKLLSPRTATYNIRITLLLLLCLLWELNGKSKIRCLSQNNSSSALIPFLFPWFSFISKVVWVCVCWWWWLGIWHDHRKSKRVPEKHLFLLYWLCQSL